MGWGVHEGESARQLAGRAHTSTTGSDGPYTTILVSDGDIAHGDSACGAVDEVQLSRDMR